MPEHSDLDALVPDPHTVTLGGTVYAVPGDMPMEIFLRMNKADLAETTVEQVEQMLDVIADLISWEQVDDGQKQKIREDVHRLLMHRGTRYFFALIREIYKADDDKAEQVAQERPTTEPVQSDEDSNGTKSSSSLPSPTTPTVIRAAEVAS